MVGGVGNRSDDGSLVINVSATLETIGREMKSDKDKLSKSKRLKSSSLKAPLNAKSWPDVDDNKDEDYYDTTAPPPSVWGKSAGQQEEGRVHKINDNNVECTDSDEDELDEGDEEIDEEHKNESDVVQPAPMVKKSAEAARVSVAAKEADKQLSKKGEKEKLVEAVLAGFGVGQKKSSGQDESREALQKKKDGELDGEGEMKDNAAGESKTAKKKTKKKEKSLKETKDAQDHPNYLDIQNGAKENARAKQNGKVESSVDAKEQLKKKKKKPSKEVDSAATVATLEAAAPNAKRTASKKKEKSHYNQQPVSKNRGA